MSKRLLTDEEKREIREQCLDLEKFAHRNTIVVQIDIEDETDEYDLPVVRVHRFGGSDKALKASNCNVEIQRIRPQKRRKR